MKCFALFRGRVTCVLPGGTRIVSLWRPYHQDAGNVIADMKRNYAKGFKVGQLFELRFVKEKGKDAKLKVKKWTPPTLGPRTRARLQRETDEMMKGIDWDNI